MIVHNGIEYPRIHFMHINKTAGRSVADWLGNNGISQESAGGSHEVVEVKEYQDDIFYFTVVRNPYDRFASHFFMWEKNSFWTDPAIN